MKMYKSLWEIWEIHFWNYVWSLGVEARAQSIKPTSFLYIGVMKARIESTHLTCADPEGGQGVPKNHKNIGFLSNIGPDPL